MSVPEPGRFRWIVRSLLASSAGTALDYTLLTTTSYLLGVRTLVATGLATTSGATLNFFLNRRFAFGTQRTPVGAQAVRFALAIGLLLAVHALTVAFLRDHLGVPLLVAKVCCDLVFLVAGQLVILRTVVFPASTA